MLLSDLSCGYYDFRGADIVVQQLAKRESSRNNKRLFKKRINVYQNICQTPLTNFHLLLFGVTTTIITKVGNVVAFSLSLVSAVRAKLDSYYLQRQVSFSHIPLRNINHIREINYRRKGLVPVFRTQVIKRCNTDYRRY